MKWLADLSTSQPVAGAVLVLMTVAISGLLLAQIKIKGIGLGVTGILFAGIIWGHLGLNLDAPVLEFVRDFGLTLFVFTIGLQLGPGFFASFREGGFKLNALAAAIVLMGAIGTFAVAILFNLNHLASLGLFSGATTNTPSLGAAQQMLKLLGGSYADSASIPALAYAAAYPGAVAGIIMVILLIRVIFTDKHQNSAEKPDEEQTLNRINLVVENPNLASFRLQDFQHQCGVVISRIKKAGSVEVETVNEQTTLAAGDSLLAVGTSAALAKFRTLVGRESQIDLRQTTRNIVTQRLFVTEKKVLGKTIASLNLQDNFGVTVTRIIRGEIEMTADPLFRLQFGDQLKVVGQQSMLTDVAKLVGNQIQATREINFLPAFIGIALGVLAGIIPISIPHVPVPVRLGLAGGPLIVAIILSRIGRVGPLIWYLPAQANLAFREFGISLFLACVGLKAGAKFFETVFTTEGLHWMLTGLAITTLPLLIAGIFARLVFKLKLTTISGLLAGSMTDPPALAFAHSLSGNKEPLIAYATVYPLAMLMRILAVQIMVILFCK